MADKRGYIPFVFNNCISYQKVSTSTAVCISKIVRKISSRSRSCKILNQTFRPLQLNARLRSNTRFCRNDYGWIARYKILETIYLIVKKK